MGAEFAVYAPWKSGSLGPRPSAAGFWAFSPCGRLLYPLNSHFGSNFFCRVTNITLD
jgi:hypothetical protein